MAGFDFNQEELYVPKGNEQQFNREKIKFLKLEDDGWYATVRFLYGPGEIFRGETVHNTAEQGQMPKYVPCLKEPNDPIEVCPLCAAGNRIQAQYFMPVYVYSITSNVRGVETTTDVNDVMIFQRGATFQGNIKSIIRQSGNKPIVCSTFRIVRNGAKGAQGTTYTVEYVGQDDATIDQFPPRPEVLGSYILPNVTKEKMIEKYINKTEAPKTTSSVTPRTINANTFAGNTVVNQAPLQAPPIGVPSAAPAPAPAATAPTVGNMPF